MPTTPPRAPRNAPALESDQIVLLERFVDALLLEDGLSANTLSAYRSDLVQLGEWLRAERAVRLSDAEDADLLAYIAARHPGSRATSSNRRLTVFRRFYRYLVRQRLRTNDPTLRIRSARQATRFPKTLSEFSLKGFDKGFFFQWAMEKIALNHVAAIGTEFALLGPRFHPFSNQF